MKLGGCNRGGSGGGGGGRGLPCCVWAMEGGCLFRAGLDDVCSKAR